MAKIKSFRLRRGTRINGYQIKERLGRGWEGEVYRVTEEYSNGQRVMKLFDPDEYRSNQMCRYSKMLEDISDVSGVVRFYHGGYWKERDCHYLIMQYIDGKPLDRCVATGPMPLFRALRIVRELLEIVKSCHNLNYRVGDINASNVILAEGDKPFIIDFDLEKRLDRERAIEDLTTTCKLLYTLERVLKVVSSRSEPFEH
jgi:serine/threonine protein kinase